MLKTTEKLSVVALMKMWKNALDGEMSQTTMEAMTIAMKVITHVTNSRKWIYLKEHTS